MRVLSKEQWTYLLLESFLGPIDSTAGRDLDTRTWHTQAFIRRIGAKATPFAKHTQSDARKSQKRGKKVYTVNVDVVVLSDFKCSVVCASGRQQK
jgi:hypothetical protein